MYMERPSLQISLHQLKLLSGRSYSSLIRDINSGDLDATKDKDPLEPKQYLLWLVGYQKALRYCNEHRKTPFPDAARLFHLASRQGWPAFVFEMLWETFDALVDDTLPSPLSPTTELNEETLNDLRTWERFRQGLHMNLLKCHCRNEPIEPTPTEDSDLWLSMTPPVILDAVKSLATAIGEMKKSDE